jgi:isopenicillin N synthase-like dioxygenase
MGMQIPIIDVGALSGKRRDRESVAAEIGRACREWGFFYAAGHGIDGDLISGLEQASREFFDRELPAKLQILMAHGGKAWRGYFPVGGELTSGRPDLKEGIYFGAELDEAHPLVKAGTPLHGPNLFPQDMPDFRRLVLDYIDDMSRLGHQLMKGLSLSLGLEESYLDVNYTSDPLILFRIFNYPPAEGAGFGVAEHTDYGFLTILWQDMSGGLQVRRGRNWFDVPPIENSFVCNIGDMLDRLTGGLYLSAAHRVQNLAGSSRLSFAFFFDPNFNAEIKPIHTPVNVGASDRWDQANVHEFRGTYGDYLLDKVSKVFPELKREVL